MPPDELTLNLAVELLDKSQKAEEPLGYHPVSSKPIYIKQGRFGPYVQLGTNDDEEKKNASLPKGVAPENVNIDLAVKLLSLPRELGNHPEDAQPVIATQGRFGPFLKHGTESRSIPAQYSLLEITLEQALEVLAQPKAPGSGRGLEPCFEQKQAEFKSIGLAQAAFFEIGADTFGLASDINPTACELMA